MDEDAAYIGNLCAAKDTVSKYGTLMGERVKDVNTFMHF